MYERFSDRARRVMQLAEDEAIRLRHPYVGTEHVAIALANEEANVSVHILRYFELDQTQIRAEVERLVPTADEPLSSRQLPLSNSCKMLLECAIKEAHSISHNYVGTEHLLMGLASIPGSTGGKTLTSFGLNLDEVRREVLGLLGHGLASDTCSG